MQRATDTARLPRYRTADNQRQASGYSRSPPASPLASPDPAAARLVFALTRFGKVAWKTAIKVATSLLVPSLACPFECRDQRPVLPDQPFLPGFVAEELTHDVVQPKKTSPRLRSSKSEIEQFPAGLLSRNPQARPSPPTDRHDADRNVGVLRCDAELAKTLALRSRQKIEADADRERHRVARCVLSPASKTVRPLASRRLFAPAIAVRTATPGP